MTVPSQLKFDNWGNFFMQRLNNLVKNDEYCDFTICSVSHESFKVHRVVLNACSDYFISQPSTEKSMTMPVYLDFDAVKSVIMFMYTGQLHFTEDSRINLIEVADMLQVSVVLQLLKPQNEAKNVTPKYYSSNLSISRTHSAIALNQYRPKKNPVSKSIMTVRSPPKDTRASTFINTMKVKDILCENKPMQFECDADDVPEFIEQTFELPKYDSAPLIKQDSAKAMIKRESIEELINKSMDIKCSAQTISSSEGKKMKIISYPDPENTNIKVVQDVLKKYPHLLPSEGNIKFKIMSCTNQVQFESIIINTPNSAEEILLARSGVKKPITTHKVKPDIMNIIGPWSCNLCGTDTSPLKLDSYLTYRRHLVEKHDGKEYTDVCEYCGYISVRKRLQMHHMYTKHYIQPPGDFKFPECDDCGYVATSKVHLKRHKSLKKCDGIKPQIKTKYGSYKCTQCTRTFCSSLMLKGHLKYVHNIYEIISSTSSTKELLTPIIYNIPHEAKVSAENNIMDKSDDPGQGEKVIYNKEIIEVETLTMEDAKQAFEENYDDYKPTVPVDITKEQGNFDDVDTNKNEESDKEDTEMLIIVE